jgi:hypothetical protein
MAISATGSFTTPAVAQAAGVSKTRNGIISYAVTGVASSDVANLTYVYGKSATPPTTFGDLSAPITFNADPADWDSYQTSFTPPGGSVQSVSLRVTIPTPADSSWSPGDTIWQAIMTTRSPVSGTPLFGVLGPILCVA